jgi:hypothetical protein
MEILAADRRIQASNTYVEKLQKLIPMEVTALFVFISTVGKNTQWEGLLGILLIALVIVLWPYLGRQNVSSHIQKLIIAVSFVLWISYTDPDLIRRLLERVVSNHPLLEYIHATPLGMIVAVWTFVIPILVSPKE